MKKSSFAAAKPDRKGRRLRLLGLLCAGALSFLTGLLCGDHVMGWPRTGEALSTALQEPAGAGRPMQPASLVAPPQGGSGAAVAGGKAVADLGRLLPPPGEFQHQAGLILGCNEMVRHYPALFGEMASALYRNIDLIGLVSNQSELDSALGILARYEVPSSAMRFVVAPVNTLWVRDYVPMFARRADGSISLADFMYDPPKEMDRRPLDEAFGKVLGNLLGMPVQAVPLTVEGGNLVTNGEGLVAATTSIIPRNASRGYDSHQIEQILEKSFGYTLWARIPGLKGEPTQHADMFMTFLAADVVVVGRMDPAVDSDNAEMLDRVAKALASVTTASGPMKVYRIPMPVPVKAGNGWRTYTNIVLANGVLLMPTFTGVDRALQSEALELYARLMPGWKVVGINCDVLASHLGLLHCVSRQIPGFVKLPPSLRPTGAPLSTVASPVPAPAATWNPPELSLD